MRSIVRGVLLPCAAILQLAGAVKTVTMSIGICPTTTGLFAPSSSPVVVEYTTTDASGHDITVSSTSYSAYTPKASYSYTIVVHSTTDASGSPTLATTTSYYPTPSTSGSTPTSTTNGITIGMGSSTMVIPPNPATTMSASAPEATSVDYPCPASIAQVYESKQNTAWQIFCETDFYYNDLPSANATTFQLCIAACDAYVPAPKGDSGDMVRKPNVRVISLS